MQRCCVPMILVALLVGAAPAAAQFESVGVITFPTSGSAEAQKHFLRGVAILHSFGWKQAIEEFQKAQKLQPDFAMPYWGETLCYNHPLNAQQQVEKPREVLKRLGATTEERLAKAPTDREKGFLKAVEVLWGEGEDRARRVGYMEQMRRLYEKYPNDPEVSAFYALSLLMASQATADRSFRLEMQAGAIALKIFGTYPNHPGAAHYTIHAFDDPIHAPLALAAAYKFAQIAPAVAHARHMPTHIFIQHGMWDRVTASNDSAYEAARDLWQASDSVGDMMHPLDWGQYGYLQLGDYARARQSIDTIKQVLDKSQATRARGGLTLSQARYIVETEEWKVTPIADDASAAELLAIGISAARTRDLATSEQVEAKLKALVEKRGGTGSADTGHAMHSPQPAVPEEARSVAVMHREVAALVRLAGGNKDEAVALMTEATKIEETMRPPNGAADPIKPSHELFGEILLEIGRPADAVKQFETSLLRMPNRARSLLGMARAAAQSGDRTAAAEHYRKLAEIWKGRDALPGYQEAKRFLGTSELP